MTTDESIKLAKEAVRKDVWGLLEHHHAVAPGVTDQIPAFVGADKAADLLTTVAAWRSARIVKANPDRAQLVARAKALESGKTVYMAVPRLASERPFYLLDPAELRRPVAEVVSHQVAAQVATTVAVDEMPAIDLVICGSVAVNAEGLRVGKGAGYSDIELALLIEAGLISARTTIVTTVHQLQIVDGPLPATPHDFRVDVIVTPESIINCPAVPRPGGIDWDDLTEDKIAAIPALASRIRRSTTPGRQQ